MRAIVALVAILPFAGCAETCHDFPAEGHLEFRFEGTADALEAELRALGWGVVRENALGFPIQGNFNGTAYSGRVQFEGLDPAGNVTLWMSGGLVGNASAPELASHFAPALEPLVAHFGGSPSVRPPQRHCGAV